MAVLRKNLDDFNAMYTAKADSRRLTEAQLEWNVAISEQIEWSAKDTLGRVFMLDSPELLKTRSSWELQY